MSWRRQGRNLEPLLPRLSQVHAEKVPRAGVGSAQARESHLLLQVSHLKMWWSNERIWKRAVKPEWDEEALLPPTLPLLTPRGVWRMSSEKWYCRLYRGRNWVLPCMKSNCILNTFSFSFHLSPFCYFHFPSPDFHSFIVSRFSSILISSVISSCLLLLWFWKHI